MEWAPIGPQLAAQLGPTSDIAWMCGLNWAWVSGLFAGYGVGPNWAPASQHTSDIAWMCGLNWALVSGLFAGYGLGPNWAPARKPCWAPRRILCGFVG